MRPVPMSRRGVLAAATMGAAGLAAGCGSKTSPDSGGTRSWSFTDDRHRTARVDHRPQRIVAYIGSAAALHDFGIDRPVVGVFGPTTLPGGKADPQAGGVDVHRVTNLGNVYGEFNLEKFAALNPDLLVTNMYEPPALWYVPDSATKKIAKLAPSIGITATKKPWPQPIQRYAALAAALGADLKSPRVVQAKQRFQRAGNDLRGLSRKRLRVLAVSASTNILYVSDPRVYCDLSYFQQLGIDLVVPNKVQGGFFENLSWENADKYPADVILLDSRTAAVQPKALKSKPTWTSLPAVKAGQVTPWLSEPRFSYAGAAPLIERFAAALRRGKKVT